MDRIWIWFADNGNIRKWSSEPFEEGTEYLTAASAIRAPAHLCGKPALGTYEGQVVLAAPDWLRQKWPSGIGIDVCLAIEIQGLWRAGVRTTGHCCGHGRQPGYISVSPEFVEQMKAMGYEAIHHPDGRDDHFAPKTALTPAPSSGEAEPFQARVQPWMMACFGPEISADRIERNHRFLEEALELVQSTGCTASEAHQLVDYVYGRPAGDTHQEIGGVMVTLAALCLAIGEDMHRAGETELARIWTKVEKIRAKQAAKPKHSPLPAHPSPSGVNAEVVAALVEAADRDPFTSIGHLIEHVVPARRALAQAAASEAGEKPEWYLSSAWTARKRPDGRWEPGVQFSGNGISWERMADKPGALEMQRFWAEEFGRIGKGDPYFYVDAPFVFVPTLTEPTEGR